MDTPNDEHPRLAIGCMSGTSLDGLDAVLVRARGSGVNLHDVEIVQGVSVDLGGAGVLRRLAAGEAVAAAEIAGAALALGRAHAEACRTLCEQAGIDRPALVCVHGQTVWHRAPVGWQVINPWPVARELGCPVVFDLRGSDLAGVGQGAPLTPLADWVLFRHERVGRVIVNLGGFCNATVLMPGGGPDTVRAADLCACSQVLDAAARAGIGKAFDPDGSHAASGRADDAAAGELTAALDAQGEAGRSLGSGDEGGAWVARWSGRLTGDDLLASACRGVGAAVARGLGRLTKVDGAGSGEVYLAGGSVRNRTLVRAIADATGGTVRLTDDLGVPAAWREGACFAVLGLLLADGQEVALPGVTGRAGPIPLSGAWILPTTDRPTAGTC